jgi:hypothetical protein
MRISKTKVCPTCREEQSSSAFGPSNQNPDGLKYACRKCTNAYGKSWNDAHPESLRGWKLMRMGLTLKQYNTLRELQGGVCASCGGFPAEGHRLEVDHNHDCCNGKFSCGECVRALLCGRCNRAAGHVQDDPDVLEALAIYLRRWDQ